MIALLVFVVSWFWVGCVYAHTPTDSSLFTDWHWRLDVLLVLLFLGATYVHGWLRLRQRAVSVSPWWQLILYLAALGSVFLALISPIDALASGLLSMHMAQHLLLLMIAPLLFLLANPLAVFLWGLPGKGRQRVGRLLIRLPGKGRHRVGRLLIRSSPFRRVLWALTLLPVAWSLYVVDLWVWHHPLFYELALENRMVHDIQHLLFFFTALLFWWPVVNPAPRLHGAVSYGFRIVYLIAATLQNTVLGMAISLPERVLYPFYETVPRLRDLSPINDQALGGGILWVSGHMYLIPIIVLVARMLTHEEEIYGRASSKEVLKRAKE